MNDWNLHSKDLPCILDHLKILFTSLFSGVRSILKYNLHASIFCLWAQLDQPMSPVMQGLKRFYQGPKNIGTLCFAPYLPFSVQIIPTNLLHRAKRARLRIHTAYRKHHSPCHQHSKILYTKQIEHDSLISLTHSQQISCQNAHGTIGQGIYM